MGLRHGQVANLPPGMLEALHPTTALLLPCRIFAFTKLNAHSSRSHCIVMLTVIRRHKAPAEVAEHVQRVKIGKLFLVDLAGSERLKRSGSTGASSPLLVSPKPTGSRLPSC